MNKHTPLSMDDDEDDDEDEEEEENESTDEELSHDESFHENERSKTHSSVIKGSNVLNTYGPFFEDSSNVSECEQLAHIRRSASGVFRCSNDGESFINESLHHDNSCILYSPIHLHDHHVHHESCHGSKDSFEGSRLQGQMTSNLNHKLETYMGFQPLETTVALSEIRSQLQELTISVENCQSDVYDVKRNLMGMKAEVDSVIFVKDEIDDIRDSLDRLEAEGERRKGKLLDQGLTFFLGYSIFSAVLGMLQFGYNTGVINAPESVIEKFIRFAYRHRYDGENMTYEASTFLYAVAVAIFALGGMVGGFMGGWIANKFGRKGGLLLNNVIGILGALGMGTAKVSASYELLIVGRFCIGVNCGLNTSLVPMYISEIAPLHLRGGLGTVNQLAVTIGLLLSQILGVESLLGTMEGWPYLLGIAIFPSVLQMAMLPLCPESPRYLLITKQQEAEARSALEKLRNSSNIEDDISEMRAEEEAQKAEATITMFELIRSPSLRLPLLIAIVMQLSQQLSGINAVFYYSTNLFIITGLSETHAKFATIGIGSVMVLMTLISIPLMDKSGRRTLHLYGLGGMFIFSIFITISFLVKELVLWIWWLSVFSTLFYVVFFAVGPGSIPWMITAELFSQGPRPAAMSVAVLINWCANFLVGIGFPTMQTALENYTFLPFSVFLAIFWVFTYRKVPETKNKTFDEIATIFRSGHKNRTLLSSSSSSSNITNNINSNNSNSNNNNTLSNSTPHTTTTTSTSHNGTASEQTTLLALEKASNSLIVDMKHYPLMSSRTSTSTSSESEDSVRSPTPPSEYSQRHHQSPSHLISPEDSECSSSRNINPHHPSSSSIFLRPYHEYNTQQPLPSSSSTNLT